VKVPSLREVQGVKSVPQRRPANRQPSSDVPVSASRRPRGEARRLLLDAARELFARQDYRRTTTREIAESAGVSEYLLFRHFGSKAGLFREALVLPFTSFVDSFGKTWAAVVPEETGEEELSRQFVGRLYDVLVENRGLLLTLVAADSLSEEEVEDAGIADIRRALTVLAQISAEGMRMRGLRSSQPDMPAHSTVAMIVGMVALRSTFFGSRQPAREVIVDELVQAILHGFLHRE
jgi:AcrR family transcriptional regulator